MIWESRHIPNPNRAHLSWFPAVKVRISESHMLMEAETRVDLVQQLYTGRHFGQRGSYIYCKCILTHHLV